MIDLAYLRLPFLRRRAAGMVEYGVLTALIAVAALGAIMMLGQRTGDLTERTGDILAGDSAPLGAPAGEPLEGALPGVLVWSPPFLNFVLSPAEPTVQATAMLANTGGGRSLPFSPPQISGPDATAFSVVATDCLDTLDAGESCTVTIEARATSNGTRTSTLGAAGAPGGVALSAAAAGFEPLLAWSPAAAVAIDGTPGPDPLPRTHAQALTLTNIGFADAPGITPTVLASSGATVALTHDCPAILPPSASCTAQVTVAADDNGPVSATFTSGGSGPAQPVEVVLAGDATGFSPAFAWSGGGTFALMAPGSNPATVDQIFTLTNIGTLAGMPALPTVSGSGPGYAFSLVSHDCAGVLSVGGTCSATVRATYTDNIASVIGTLGGSANLVLTGSASGFTPAFTWSGGGAFTLTGPMGNPGIVERTFTLTNTGTLAGVPTLPTVSGSGSGYAFSLVSHDCAGVLSVDGTCSATVRATYTDNVAAATGTLGGPAPQALTGSASGFAAALVWQNMPADFALDIDTGSNTATAISTPGPTGTATLRNNGTLASGPITVALAGPHAAAFEIVSNGCSGVALTHGATCQVQARLRAGTALGTYSLQLSATASPTILSPARAQRVRGARLILVSDNNANLSHGNWGSQGAVREWRIRNVGNRDAQNLQVGGLQGSAFNWALYNQFWGIIAHGANPWATITLAPGQDAILHAALFSGQQLSAYTTSSHSATVFLGDVPWAAISGTYMAAPAMAWVGGGGHAMDANAGGLPPGMTVWSAWHRMTVRNTGNVTIWAGNGIEANDWNRIAWWGGHTCANRWLNPGEECFRDVAYFYIDNETIHRWFIVWGNSTNPGWLHLFGHGTNFYLPLQGD
jgi:Flp pilus assembly pilin Flp